MISTTHEEVFSHQPPAAGRVFRFKFLVFNWKSVFHNSKLKTQNLKLAAAAAALVLLALPVAAQSCKEEEYDKVQMRYVEAIKFMQAGKFKEAIPHLKCCVEYKKEWGEGWRALGDCYLQLKDTKNAMTAYTNARKVGFESPGMLANLANIHRQAGDKAKAQEILQSVNPETYQGSDAEKTAFYRMRGKILLDEKNFASAARDFEKAFAIEKKPDHAYYAGIAHLQANDLDKALPLLGEAVKLDAKNKDARYRLADLQMQKAQRDNADALWAQAAQHADALTKAAPNEAKYWRLLGEANIGVKKFDAAVAALAKAAAIDPANCLTKHNIGRAYNFAKSWDNAIKALLDAAKCDPKDNKIQNDLGWAYENKWQSGKKDLPDLLNQAKAVYAKANQLKPGSGASHEARVAALLTNFEADAQETAATARDAAIAAEKKRLLALVKITEPKRTSSTVAGKVITMVFGTVRNDSDTLVNAMVEVVFVDAAGKEMQKLRAKVQGIAPKGLRPLSVEAEGVEKAADYRVKVVDLEFQFKG